MNYAIIIIDYLMQSKEQTKKFMVAEAKEKLYGLRNEMPKDDYLRTYELIDRIAKLEQEK